MDRDLCKNVFMAKTPHGDLSTKSRRTVPGTRVRGGIRAAHSGSAFSMREEQSSIRSESADEAKESTITFHALSRKAYYERWLTLIRNAGERQLLLGYERPDELQTYRDWIAQTNPLRKKYSVQVLAHAISTCRIDETNPISNSGLFFQWADVDHGTCDPDLPAAISKFVLGQYHSKEPINLAELLTQSASESKLERMSASIKAVYEASFVATENRRRVHEFQHGRDAHRRSSPVEDVVETVSSPRPYLIASKGEPSNPSQSAQAALAALSEPSDRKRKRFNFTDDEWIEIAERSGILTKSGHLTDKFK